MILSGKTILITGAARRLGRHFALTVARAGADVVLHHGHSAEEAGRVRAEVEALDRKAWVLQADLAQPAEAAGLVARARELVALDAVVNSAAIFEPGDLAQTDLDAWNRHMAVNCTAPFLISRDFAAGLTAGTEGRIVNILDWRALRPGADHFAYTVSKAALAAMTRSLALSLAPQVAVNGLALGAILPPADGGDPQAVLKSVPAGRWASLDEVADALLFLLTAGYITGQIVHLDGGRHLV